MKESSEIQRQQNKRGKKSLLSQVSSVAHTWMSQTLTHEDSVAGCFLVNIQGEPLLLATYLEARKLSRTPPTPQPHFEEKKKTFVGSVLPTPSGSPTLCHIFTDLHSQRCQMLPLPIPKDVQKPEWH